MAVNPMIRHINFILRTSCIVGVVPMKPEKNTCISASTGLTKLRDSSTRFPNQNIPFAPSFMPSQILI